MNVSRRRVLGQLSAAAGLSALPGGLRADETETSVHLLALLIADRARTKAALAHLTARGGKDLISPLIFALRYSPGPERPLVELLQEIAGVYGPEDWHEWMLWQEAHPEIAPHPALIEMKREVYLSIDSYFEPFLKTEYLQPDRMKIRLEEIAWG
ncbi:MAG: hypothetical protein AAF526_09710, partial [Pseudomonadota bacterium]